MNGYRIMIVEDELSIQTQLKTLLSGNGYTVRAVTDFSETVRQIKAFAPHLILLDMLAKIASLLRRTYASVQTEILTWNGAVLHLESSFLEYNGQKADLTKNELKILYYLFKNAGKICPRSDIVDFFWDNQLYVDDNTLSVHMSRIREKLSSIGLTGFIKTKHRQGYTL